ncbi:MAG: IPT/TIG domain-containing protein [Terracidiphilus sp.]
MVSILLNTRKAQVCLLALLVPLLVPTVAVAGGPKYVAGVSFFNPGVLGQPVHWSGGQLNYYVDQGPLNSMVTNQQATAMVDAAAALWSAIPTAGVTLADMGPLNEDVSGSNIAATNGIITAPADVTPSATNYPLGILYDADGSVIDAIFGTGASDPASCKNDGVWFWLDNINPDATIVHGIILLNGLCATNTGLLAMMSYELERAFGRILGLDYTQINTDSLQNRETGESGGWPVMQPLGASCGPSASPCLSDPAQLAFDDIAALNRIYPITAANQASFPGKQLTAANTVSIQGTITFRNGYGMQGVNVVARPLDSNGNPLYQYTVTFVSGGYFNGNHGNPVTGFDDANGNLLSEWGSNDPTLQGYFDLSGMPVPPGVTAANYQVTFETINPLYILFNSVGPYIDGQVTPSGTLAAISVPNMSSGSAQTLTVNVADSAAGSSGDAIDGEATPRMLAPSGLWCGRISQIGQTDWFTFPVRGNRIFTIVTQALDQTGMPTDTKAMPAIGIWDAFDPVGAPAAGAVPGLNGLATGETWLRVATNGDDVVRIGIADQRGDGRPDYPYNGWVLYADTVAPLRLPAAGGAIVIHGMGFRLADTVLVGGRPAQVTAISPNEITAIAPPAATGVTGSVDVEVDDQPPFYAAAVLPGGVSYDSGTGDALTLVTAPSNTIPIGVPIPFTVTALGPDLTPAGGVTITYTVTGGTATLSCGQPTCAVTASGDGHATMNVTAVNGTWSIITASLTNGSNVQAQFTGGTPPVLTAVTPQLSLAAGATFTWTVQALVLSSGIPLSAQNVAWQPAAGSGIVPAGNAAALTNLSGIATNTLTVGPLTEGQTATINACLNGSGTCVAFTAFGARPEYATIQAVSGTIQSLPIQSTPAQIAMRLLDMDGNPMAGGTVSFYQALYAWAPPCADHGVCAPAPLLATQTASATSALDGTVSLNPASLPGVATNLIGLAASGNTSTLSVAIEQHP